ncbi:MAG: hypothetical protein HRT35_04835 [Algicola sp.]|nr:hypothetical protein [Algicola sp.]
MNIWKTLGIEPTTDNKAIKKAYAAKIKQTKPDQNPTGYQQLREAFEAAKKQAKNKADTSIAQPDTTYYDDAYFQPPTEINYNQQTVIPETSGQQAPLQPTKQQIKLNKQKAWQQLAESSCQRIFKIENNEAQCEQFRQILKGADFETIDAQAQLSRVCLQAAFDWPQDIVYPGAVVYLMAKEFNWFEHYADNETARTLNFVKNRINAYILHKRLLGSDAAQGKNSSWKSRKAIKVLNHAYDPAYFRKTAFLFGHVKNHIDHIISTLLNSYDQFYYPQLNSKTFNWWLEQHNKTMISLNHFAKIAFLATILFLGLNITTYKPLANLADLEKSVLSLTLAMSIALFYWFIKSLYNTIRRQYLQWREMRWMLLSDEQQRQFIIKTLALIAFYGACLIPHETTRVFIFVVGSMLLAKSFGLMALLLMGVCLMPLIYFADSMQLKIRELSAFIYLWCTCITLFAIYTGIAFKTPKGVKQWVGLKGLRFVVGAIAFVSIAGFSLLKTYATLGV